MAIPRKAAVLQLNPKIDIYDCSDESFFLDQETISPSIETFKFQVDVKREEMATFRTIQFSKNNVYMATISDRVVRIFDLQNIEDYDIQGEEKERVLDSEEEHTFKLDNKTYDQIIGVDIDESDVMLSWLVLVSKTFQCVHFIRLRDLHSEVN